MNANQVHFNSVFFVVTEIENDMLKEVLSYSKWNFPITFHLYFININPNNDTFAYCTEYYRIKSKIIVNQFGSKDIANRWQFTQFSPKEFMWSNLMHNSARRKNFFQVPIIGVARVSLFYHCH